MTPVTVMLALAAAAFVGLVLFTEPTIGDWWRKRR